MGQTILYMENIHKKFPGVYALDGVDFELRYGEVHALLGENGAGIYTADKGQIYMKGQKVKIRDVHQAKSYGISVIHQELCLAPNMTVADNIFLGREVIGKNGLINISQQYQLARELLDGLGLKIPSSAVIASLSVAQQQMVEIAKALSMDAKIIVMDEPTAALSLKEVDMLFQTIETLKRRNISIVYISHRMEELFRVADRVTVLRDGKYVGTKEIANTTGKELISMMVGRELNDLYKRTLHPLGDIVLEINNLNRCNSLHDIGFVLRKGEILGVSGLVGAGRTELARAIFGIDKIDTGEIVVNGEKVMIGSPIDAMNYGIALVPEDRKNQGLLLIKEVSYNITLAVLERFIKGIRVDHQLERKLVDEYIEKLSIKTPSYEQIVNHLSGGNQQKIVIAKWLATTPKILILDEPTRGVDVGAKSELYSIINMLAEQGVAIMMISSELPEIINMSDRVLVMHNGRITGELTRSELDQEKIMFFATGGIKDAS
jgi:ABC-type sugar transport system ATPase subunit